MLDARFIFKKGNLGRKFVFF